MKSIDKHWFLRKVDCEFTEWSRNIWYLLRYKWAGNADSFKPFQLYLHVLIFTLRSAAITMLCRFVTTIEGKLMYCRKLLPHMSILVSSRQKNTMEMFCHDPENRWILMPFPVISREDIESLNFAHQLGILYLHTLTVFVSEILLVCTISASSTYG